MKYSILNPLTHIFNLSFKQGEFPDTMKLSEIISLFKTGHRDQMINYRPISLLITLSKLLEKSMYTQLYNFVTKHNIFYNKQYGFGVGIPVNKPFRIYMVKFYKIKIMESRQLLYT